MPDAAPDPCRSIAEAWRARAADPRLHVAWQRVGNGEYVGTVGGYRVTLYFRQSYESVALSRRHSQLRDPARTRNGLLVGCTLADGRWAIWQPPLADVAVRGEGMRATGRFETRRRNLEARALRVFGFTPEWGR